MAFGGHTHWYTSSAKWSAATTWATGQAKTVGNIVKQSGTPTVGNERTYVCIVAGTTGGGADPLTTFTRGAKITDNTVTWQEATGIPALNGDLTNTPSWATSRAANTAVTLGHVIKDNAGTHIFICTTAGTVGASEPSFNFAALGNTTTDNTCTWTYIGTSFGAWAAPHARLDNALATTWGDTGTNFFVGHDHNETRAASITYASRGSNAAPLDWLCVNTAGSVPPVSADLTTGATITTTGSQSVNINSALRICKGIRWVNATSGSGAIATNTDSDRNKYFEDCVFEFGAGAGNGTMDAGNAASSYTEFKNCTIKFSGTGQRWAPTGKFLWRDSVVVDAAGSLPTTLIVPAGRADVTFRGCDFSALSAQRLFDQNSNNVILNISLEDCELPSSFTTATLANFISRNMRLRLSRCSSAGNLIRSELHDFLGQQFTEIALYRDDGAAVQTVPFSWRLVSNTNVNTGCPHYSMPIGIVNEDVDPTTVVATIHGIINAAAVPNNNEVWFDVNYPGDATAPRSSVKSSKLADVLATPAALTADSASAWDLGVTARANAHAYSLGDMIKLASNPGRVFFCTTAGTSAGSEPGGYASAVDGGSVTDNTAVFRAACRFSTAVSLATPKVQLAGLLKGIAFLGKVSTTVYIDPQIELS